MNNEHTLHFHIDLSQDGSHNVTISKTRIWPPLLKYLQWATFGKEIPGNVTGGLGLTIINNLAIIVEGVITDIIEEHVKYAGVTLSTPIDFDRDTWQKKERAYDELFSPKLQDYHFYETVKVLFWFRNNIAHGRSHSEMSKIDITTNSKSFIESENTKYEKVRDYLIGRRMLAKTDTLNNIDLLWKLENALLLFSEVKMFLNSVIEGTISPYTTGILSEWKTANNV